MTSALCHSNIELHVFITAPRVYPPERVKRLLRFWDSLIGLTSIQVLSEAHVWLWLWRHCLEMIRSWGLWSHGWFKPLMISSIMKFLRNNETYLVDMSHWMCPGGRHLSIPLSSVPWIPWWEWFGSTKTSHSERPVNLWNWKPKWSPHMLLFGSRDESLMWKIGSRSWIIAVSEAV